MAAYHSRKSVSISSARTPETPSRRRDARPLKKRAVGKFGEGIRLVDMRGKNVT